LEASAALDREAKVLHYAGRPRADAYVLVKRTLNIRRLEPHVYAEEEYEQARPVVERMIRGGISIV